jgi:hypothetical protein
MAAPGPGRCRGTYICPDIHPHIIDPGLVIFAIDIEATEE